MTDVKKHIRNTRRSIVSDKHILTRADEILKEKDSSISEFCHNKLVELVEKDEKKKEKK